MKGYKIKKTIIIDTNLMIKKLTTQFPKGLFILTNYFL